MKKLVAAISLAKHFLKEAIGIYEDGVLYDNAEWLEFEQIEACENFIVIFEEIADAFVDGQLPESFHQDYLDLDVGFRRYFAVWSVCEGMLESMRDSNHRQHWFLLESPVGRPIIPLFQIKDRDISIFGKILSGSELTSDDQLRIKILFESASKSFKNRE